MQTSAGHQGFQRLAWHHKLFAAVGGVLLLMVLIPKLSSASGACATTSVISGGNTIEFCTDTSATAWTVPSGVSSVSVEVIGGGGGAATGNNSGGSGGGAYAKAAGLSVVPGSSVSIQVGPGGTAGGGTGGDTYFNGSGTTCSGQSVCAKGGAGSSGSAGAAGGSAASSIGTTKYGGGTGGNGTSNGGGAAGGAAGPSGAGAAGGAGGNKGAGGGGGGNGGGSAGAPGVANGSGGNGGNNSGSTGHGTGGTLAGAAPTAGTAGGGGGGACSNKGCASDQNGKNGGAGTEWNATHGSGGGGGGNAGNASAPAGQGGLYGGGSGGGTGNTGTAGAQGIIVITYPTPAAPDTTPPSTPSNLSATAVSTSEIDLSWSVSSDNVGVTGYKVYRGGSQIGTASGTTYGDTGLAAGTAYTYTVSAHDAAGNDSNQSSSASATTQSNPPPSGAAIVGYAWSDTTGWISMHGSNYGLYMDSNGTITGYAWSDSTGWVSAYSTDIASCQSGAASRVQGGIWGGWLRAIAGAGSGSGGWDGCISMSGSNYGVSYNNQSGNFGGYAWGSTDVGWVDFSQASTTPQVPECQTTQGTFCKGNDIYHRDAQCNETYQSTCSYQCSNGACLPPPAPQGNLAGTNNLAITANPSIVPSGETTTIEWDVVNVSSCNVSGSNGDAWTSVVDSNDEASGSRTSSTINKQTTYTLSCTDLSGAPFVRSTTVNVIPVFREI